MRCTCQPGSRKGRVTISRDSTKNMMCLQSMPRSWGNGSFQPEFRPGSGINVHIEHVCLSVSCLLLQSPSLSQDCLSRARGAEEMAIPPSPSFLVHNWSGTYQSPGTCPLSYPKRKELQRGEPTAAGEGESWGARRGERGLGHGRETET